MGLPDTRQSETLAYGNDVRLSDFTLAVRRNWIPALGLILSAIVALWFAIGFVLDVAHLRGPRPQDPDLKEWMTPRHVVMSWRLPPQVVFSVFDIKPHVDKRRKLDDIADDLGITLEELNVRLRAAAAVWRAEHR